MVYPGGVGEDQPDNNAGGAVERVTAHEAAALLGVHYNTIRNRIKAGMYRAEKVHTENGPTWMIERDSLTNNAPTSARQQAVSGVPAAQQEALQELARAIRAIVREAGLQPDPEDSEAKANLKFERERRLEFWKIQYDYFKHLMTLALASIAGLGAMLGGVFSAFVGDPISEILIYAIFGCFVGVLLLSFEAMRGYRKRLNLLRKVVAEEDIKKLPHTVGPYLGWLGIFAFVLFAAGIFLFLAFVGINLGLFGKQGV
jgi:hypothetical protein